MLLSYSIRWRSGYILKKYDKIHYSKVFSITWCFPPLFATMVDPCFDSLKNADAVVPRFKAWNELVVKMRIKDALIFIGMVIVQIQQVHVEAMQ
ncbi:hypothetical protein P8452_28318 [Trifolium repens]|nr:hypothetical protein P8452_28318 [Trifolium repens]